MLYIAHRGNINGPNPALENSPVYIMDAICAGYKVEVDVWGIEGELWLGHDGPQYKVPHSFFRGFQNDLYCHCKNVEAIDLLRCYTSHSSPTWFFHNTDDYTLTSNGYVWCYPGKRPPRERGIIVLKGDEDVPFLVDGVCSDYVAQLKHK